jgi:hypothetical protein
LKILFDIFKNSFVTLHDPVSKRGIFAKSIQETMLAYFH